MSAREEWLSIAAACEGATGPDADIDWRITLALGIVTLNATKGTMEYANAFAAVQEAVDPVPYTASLDAITAAIGEHLPGWVHGYQTRGPHSGAIATAFTREDWESYSGPLGKGEGKTPALALCAAFCMAMAERRKDRA